MAAVGTHGKAVSCPSLLSGLALQPKDQHQQLGSKTQQKKNTRVHLQLKHSPRRENTVAQLKGQTHRQTQDVSGLGRPYQLPIHDMTDFLSNVNR